MSKSANETSSSGFLGGLGPSIRRYPYKGTEQFLEFIKMEQSRQKEEFEASEWVLFTNVNKQTFNRDFLNTNRMVLERCWNSYDSSQDLLLVKTTVLRAHDITAHVFAKLLIDCLRPMDLDNNLQLFRSASCIAENGSAKQPDCQYVPDSLPRARTDKWPSLVVETGFSESPCKLMSDARFWLSESNGDVQVVLTIKIGRSSPNIVLEAWELVDDKVKCQQIVSVSKGENGHLYFQGQPLIISFEKLFLRLPSIPNERDITLDEASLEQLATHVWHDQGF
ncbi:uncharacterized protein N7515_007895 [Penicillium bovifimosum]|uniref:Uncharacterized protein n=1 Tax=Penicillium bovifimosum TaxID=126998 RepID=A0A9W9GLW3_9EURO|nr:uncharacterized protein N7515_007895 [Penicillium bovifimosum]KAJ5124070.1 hypothetical protein N7515_007895 [Penicillium bovifimosum]